MLVVGYAAVVVGYALLYSGASNIFTDGQGWGLWKALTGKGENTPTIAPGSGATSPSKTVNPNIPGSSRTGSPSSGGKSAGEFAPGTGGN